MQHQYISHHAAQALFGERKDTALKCRLLGLRELFRAITRLKRHTLAVSPGDTDTSCQGGITLRLEVEQSLVSTLGCG